MIDPMSALSIAAGVVQFVDFGKHLLSASYEIYRSPSGETSKEVEFSTIAKDLTALITQIKDRVGKLPRGEGHNTAAQYQLVKISEECEEIFTQFQEALHQLEKRDLLSGREGKQKEHPKSRLKVARGTIRRALGSVWNAPKTDSMIKKLEKTKGRMMTVTLFCLW
jgi:hypothetical protein